MQDLPNTESNDEINLHELFITLWAYKFFIASTCALGVIFGGYFALKTNKKFTSAAIFKLDDGNPNSLSLPSELNSMIKLSGLDLGSATSSTIPLDQIKGRIFLEKLNEKLNFEADTYFNTYDPNSIEPIWRSVIKRAIGWQKSSTDVQETIWQGIIEKYSNNVMLTETKEGSVKIEATHEISQRAADIANVIMDTIISNAKDKRNKNIDQILSYMSNTVVKALNDLEVSQSNLKEFALKNSALPLENFAAGSLELDALREQLSRTSELHEAVAALSLMLQNKTTDQKDYLTLRQKFPIVDRVEFRRVLGQNEIISAWNWPKISSVNAVFDTLSERKSRLQSEIKASQIDAERSGLALQTYAKLEREAKIAEATYTLLIEQVKSQSMAAGFRPDNTEIYEYATASISPSSPKRDIILTLGATLGLFLGVVLSLIFGLVRGVYYSKKSLKTGAQAQLTANIRAIKPLRNKSLEYLNSMLVRTPNSVLRDIAVEIHKHDTTQVVVTSLRANLTGNDVGRALASYMQSDFKKVAVIDFSSKTKRLDNQEGNLSIESFIISESLGNVLVLRPNDGLAPMDLLSQKDFAKNIHSLSSTIDLLFLCADNDDAISLLRTLQGQKTYHIALARTKHTKSVDLMHISSLLPIQGMLHD